MLGPNIHLITTDNIDDTILFLEKILHCRNEGQGMGGVVFRHPLRDKQFVVVSKSSVKIKTNPGAKVKNIRWVDSYQIRNFDDALSQCQSLLLEVSNVDPDKRSFEAETPWGTTTILQEQSSSSVNIGLSTDCKKQHCINNKGGTANGSLIETGAELYREMKNRGLHLRREHGRDDALIAQLANRLGCKNLSLQAFLNDSDLSAQDFMISFVDIAQPFALMFTDIWDYLSTYSAIKSSESIAVRFGFPDTDDQSVITLQQFRRYVERIRRTILTVNVWPKDAIYSLYGLYRILLREVGSGVSSHRYQESEVYTLPKVSVSGNPFDEIANRIQRLFQRNIDAFAEKGRFSIGNSSFGSDPTMGESSTGFPTRHLTADLLPFWQRVFEVYSRVSDKSKNEALEYYNENTLPLMRERREEGIGKVIEALDIIDLPFWRHRWHTYEVWATVATFRALREYNPIPRVTRNSVPIDGYEPAIVADVDSKGFPNACVAVQVQTPYIFGKRKAIKPDLRVCFSDHLVANETAAIVEFKQRKRLSRAEMLEVSTSYLQGSPRCGGVIILNYDVVPNDVELPDGALLITNVHPCNQEAVAAFQSALTGVLENVSFKPSGGRIVVLLDVSGSMEGNYATAKIQDAMRRLLSVTSINVFTFNDGLTSNQRLERGSSTALDTSGGTDLGKALDDLERGYGLPNKLLIVSDGYYQCPKAKLERIRSVKECLPEDIESNIQWLLMRENLWVK